MRPREGQQQRFKGLNAVQRVDANRSALIDGFKAQKMGDSADLHGSGPSLNFRSRQSFGAAPDRNGSPGLIVVGDWGGGCHRSDRRGAERSYGVGLESDWRLNQHR